MTNQTSESVIAAAMIAAGAPLMHSQVEEAVAAALRAANMLREPGLPDAATKKFASTIYPDYGGLTAAVFERSHEPAFSDDSGGLREARAFAESLVEMYIDQHGMKQLKAARDAALAAIERVRALAEQWSSTPDYQPSEYDKGRVDQRHDMTEQLLAALDGAPEPEWEWGHAEVETKREMTNPVYVLRGGVYLLDEHAGVLIDSAGNFSAKTKGNPRSLAVLLKAIAEAIEDDVEVVPVKGEADGA